ncbi:hypothetical protein [Flavobacterium difficile]|uniref:Uncharacterized protein n=1 Tax=Flavobacterium difficile TaxID=2709659 RepID=A0ABX0I8H9_9FLAO|nr:hypothetical protein [Flavobacterium difficile]NHM01756.1 hypothetical protein [Flavobacterium difficile]
MMKNYIYLFVLIFVESNGQVGIGTTTPHDDVALEVFSTDKTILITKVNLENTNLSKPLTTHVAGMIVYNTNTAGSGDTAVTPGLYYNNSVKWVRLEPISIQIGDIKHSIATEDHLGWYMLDGRSLSTLPILAQVNGTSLGFSTHLPDATDKILKGKSLSESLIQTGGSNTVIISQANLPNIVFSGTTSSDGEHDHGYVDQHNSAIENINVVYGLLGILSGVALNVLNSNIGNKTPATQLSNSSSSGNHTHTVTVQSGGNNMPLPSVKKMATNTFVYLGE